MRNPDEWWPLEPEEPYAHKPSEGGFKVSGTRRGALVGLVLILLLIAGGILLTHVLRSMSKLQDCALSGRSNCN